MSHDKLKAAARKRMARTGEPYNVARRAVIRRREEAQHGDDASEAARSSAFDVMTRQLVIYGQQVRGQLGRATGIDEIQRRFAALHWFRQLGHSVDDRPSELDAHVGRPHWRCHRCGSDLQLDSGGNPVSSGGTGRCVHEGATW